MKMSDLISAQAARASIEAGGIIAILRGDFAARIVQVGEALLGGGITTIEMTLNSPGALAAISQLREALGGRALIGAGTVMTPDEAGAALAHGAQFVVAPDSNPEVVAACRAKDCAMIPGAMTATEVAAAWRMGATMVKVFPAGSLGPGYLRALRGPLPHIPLVPTGGMELENVAGFIEAGAAAVGVGGPLVGKKAPTDLAGLAARAAEFVKRVAAARRSSGQSES